MSFSFNIDNVQDVIWNECVFTPKECQEIIEHGNKKELLQGAVGNETEDFSIRKNKISWIEADKESYPLYDKFSKIIVEANEKFFNFNLWGFAEPLQFTKYESNDEYYGLHMDKGLKSTIRKLSISLQLSKPEDYEGGDLIINLGKNNETTMKRSQGTVVVFPSYVLHEVKPVTKGTRYSLVGWVTGEQFK